MVFNLGSLIHPKQMLKLLKEYAMAKVNVVNIYNYLYKFSLERLQQFLNNKSLMLLFVNYLKVNKFRRIHTSHNMVKYRFAYYEACQIMISQSSNLKPLGQIFDFVSMLKPPSQEQFLQDSKNSDKD